MYLSHVDHPIFGRLWFRMYLRNWDCLGAKSMQENLDRGPLCELSLVDYLQGGSGSSPQEAVDCLVRMLDWYVQDGQPLPVERPKPWWRRLRSWWSDNVRLRWLLRRWEREGKLHRVKLPPKADRLLGA